MEYNVTDNTEQYEEDSSFPEMVSPLNIFVWFGTFGWLGLSVLYLADMELSGLIGKIIWYTVPFIGMPLSWVIVSYAYRQQPLD
ncbi:hypothetical protein EQO05_00975 [Methanosarcina sp. MSH10X1]|uniref:hypothetical protein n=1 Tax=Methanosarcina sp. MSH10X1 TaxID=2507075 RepID=UPI000FFB46A4|nr:hypothetical protein [Methanosarcina sp. MSH10X1]RXA21841.1 hypothetical protein EQO05_00975 [Methanosarcina sp. MSH10X1]